MRGYIKLHRSITNTPDWLAEPFTRGQAWVDLLILANHKDGYIRIAGEKISVKRGQCGWSIVKLSDRWKWSRGKTKRFLTELEKDRQITLKTDTRNSIITICNYTRFQSDDTTDDTTDGHQTDTNKNDKNDNKKNTNAREKITFSFDDGSYSGITDQKLALWKEAFPAVNIEHHIKRSAVWLLANPKNRKSNYEKFITNWLQREQDKAPSANSQGNANSGQYRQPTKSERADAALRKSLEDLASIDGGSGW